MFCKKYVFPYLVSGACVLAISSTLVCAGGQVVASADTVNTNEVTSTIVDDSSGGVVAPIDSNVEQVDMTNAELLQRLQVLDPIGYSKMPQSYIQGLLRQDMMRQGTTKYVKEKHGHYRIYINSAIVKGIKYGYIGVAAYLVAISPLSAGTSAAVGAVIGSALGSIPSNKGAWFEFSKSKLVKYGQQ
ncbi:hypothetical protein D8911_05795 [Levilactobacillus brevis]|nr:hypothetical protein D8911_05795 [Levilactobacillus brevis]